MAEVLHEQGGRTYREVVRRVRVTAMAHDAEMADGALVLATSHQLAWFYVTVVKDGTMRRRRYRHGASVKVIEWEAVPNA